MSALDLGTFLPSVIRSSWSDKTDLKMAETLLGLGCACGAPTERREVTDPSESDTFPAVDEEEVDRLRCESGLLGDSRSVLELGPDAITAGTFLVVLNLF